MSFELLLDVDEVVIILEPKEYQEFDFAMKRIIHNEMLDYYHNKNWNRVVTHCMDLKGEFGGALDHYYIEMKDRVFKLKLQEILDQA